MAAARGEEPEYSSLSEQESSDEEEDCRTVSRRRKHKESSSEDDQESQDDTQIDDEDIEVPPFNESAMGAKGEPFTDADLAIVARHMTLFHDFREASFQDKWVPFAAKVGVVLYTFL